MQSDRPSKPRSFWTTLPGLFTAAGAFLGSVATLITALYSAGLLGPPKSSSTAPLEQTGEARLEAPSGGVPNVRANSLEHLKGTINALQIRGFNELQAGELDTAFRTFQEAQQYLDQADTRAPEDITLLEMRGYMLKDWALVCQDLSKTDEADQHLKAAEAAFQAVLKRQPSASAYNGLGSVYILRGDLDRAEQEIRRALQLEPGYEAAKHDLALIQQRRNKPVPTPALSTSKLVANRQVPCTPTYPIQPAPQGWRVLFIGSSNSAVEGAQVYLDGKCQGRITRRSTGEQFLMLRVPPGKYEITVKKDGFVDFQRNVDIAPSLLPDDKTPKVPVLFDLVAR